MQIIPVILSGGAGTRLWPLSRETLPKQFLPLWGSKTLFQQTVLRVTKLPECGKPMVVSSDGHRFLVTGQLEDVGVEPGAVVLEPVGRNTAPAVAAAALEAVAAGEDPLLLILPADHVIRDEEGFCASVSAMAPVAQAGRLVTFGILPTSPETGYGYIKGGRRLVEGSLERGKGSAVHDDELSGVMLPEEARLVECFVEKPDADTAQAYMDTGDYYWNSGMFLFRASVYLEELQRQRPDVLAGTVAAWENAVRDDTIVRLDSGAFAACPADSIDYAVMERTAHGVVIPVQIGWSDVGSWAALHEAAPQDDAGNAFKGDVVAVDTADCYVNASERLVSTVGVSGLIVVETPDAVLVSARHKAQDVKRVVDALREAGRKESAEHRRVLRPWGSYQTLDAGDSFQVKRITVKSGGILSLQRHRHRSEYWTVVRGCALVSVGPDVERLELHDLTPGQSIHIPLGALHRLENRGVAPLEIIEVQCGSYLGEDDIERLEDVYGRTLPANKQ